MKRPIILFVLGMVLVGCTSPIDVTSPTQRPGEGFAIYLLAEELFLWEIEDFRAVELAETPVISTQDILSYDWDTHEIKLESSAAERYTELELAGRPFIVTVDKQPIYVGEFMAMFMSRSSESVVIFWPFSSGDAQTIRIVLGYPGPDLFVGEDPRSDPRIFDALQLADKLN